MADFADDRGGDFQCARQRSVVFQVQLGDQAIKKMVGIIGGFSTQGAAGSVHAGGPVVGDNCNLTFGYCNVKPEIT